MKSILILISIMLLASCAHKFDVEKANTYLMSHPDRPAHIKEALLAGNVVQGMNEDEVYICAGKPNRIITTQKYPSNKKFTVWSYLRGAPSKGVFILFMDGTVKEVNVSTQTGTRGPYLINPGPIIVRKYPSGTINPRPLISPPSVNRKCSSK